jgi:hypothetical protein
MTDLEKDNVLVTCPTYIGKVYALEAYVTAYNNFSYPHRGLFMVDNTGHNSKMTDYLKQMKVPCDYVAPARDWQKTFARCWKRILKAAKDGNYRWVASIEADNICPPLTLDIMLNVAQYTKAVHVAHSYLWHRLTIDRGEPTTSRLIGLGCNLILTEVVERIFAQKTWPTDAFEAECYEYPKRTARFAWRSTT